MNPDPGYTIILAHRDSKVKEFLVLKLYVLSLGLEDFLGA
jgi:hypothetical protein